MYSSLFASLLCAFLLLVFRRNSVLCSLSGDLHSHLQGGLASRRSSHPPNHSANDSYSNVTRINTSSSSDHFKSSDRHSQHSDKNVLDNRLNKKFTPSIQPTNRAFPNSSRRSISDLNQIFHKVYESNYAHFCPCPPELAGARHSLEGAEDRTITECIYLPLTTVQYRCSQTTKKQSSQTVDRLICDLNRTTNRLNWIIDVDDKLLDLDDLLVYRDQFTVNQTGRNETMEIRAQSAQLADFSIEFLQCNDPSEETASAERGKLTSRPKRSYSLERNIEILIVIDSLMNRYHGENLENYIYTLMSTVSSIYKDASIGNNINVAVVQLILLTEKESKQLISSSAANTLDRFCRWQANLNANRTDAHPLYHDMAILLTRTDLCRSAGNCDTLGLAHSGKICDRKSKSSCAIVEDNGLSAALTIAHEIGHNLGTPHDQDEKCRGLAEDRLIGHDEQFNIMGRMLDLNSYPWRWSECSAYFLTEFFNSGKGDCLLDKPKRNFLDVMSMRGVTEEAISQKYERLLKTKSTSDHRLLNAVMGNNRIERGRRDHRSNYFIRNEIDRNSFLMPGQYFNTNLQCQLIFGPDSRVCPYMSPCRRLWCTSGSALSSTSSLRNENLSNDRHAYKRKLAATKQTDAGCKTQHQPWSDGSPCSNSSDEERFCVRGECVSLQAYLKNSSIVDGGWSDWSNWTECSRTCGGGVRSSFRVCNSPEPRNGGAYCLGQRQRYESCHVHSCPEGVADFRAEQCAQFNNRALKNLPNNVTWLPHYAGVPVEDLCKLYCKVESTGAYFLLKNKVLDGTDCLDFKMESGKCVDGRCVSSGCDHVIHSQKKLDECGVCGGNSTCRLIEGRFDGRSVHYGYNYVVKIPAGAINIRINLDGTADDDNSLALRSHNGSYLINGDAIISNYERVVFYDGVKIVYSGTGFVSSNETASSLVDQNVSAEEEMLRLSRHEQRLREEYNSQLDKLGRNRASYSRAHIERLHEQQNKIKEYRRQIQNLEQEISSNSGQTVKQRIKRPPFVESISIKQALRNDLIVEVLSVGRLIRPEIVYKFSIPSKETGGGDDKKAEDERVVENSDHLKQSLKHRKLIEEKSYSSKHPNEKKEIDRKQLNIDENNLRSNDQLILRKLEDYADERKHRRSNRVVRFRNETDRYVNHNIKIGQNLYVKRSAKRIQISCPPRQSMRSLMNSKWFKNGNEIPFSFEQLSASEQNSRDDERFAEEVEKNNAKTTARYQITRHGSLVIRNVKQTDSGIYACPFYISFSQIFVI